MQYLKQSTAATIVLGPFVDSTDGVTAETGLTLSQADIRLSKNGGAFAQVNESTSASHMENGYYSKALNTTDTNTLGVLKVAVNESGALPVWEDYTVLAANIYDALIGGGDLLQVDVQQFGNSNGTFASGVPAVNATQISGDSTAADNLETAFDDTAGSVPWMGIVDQGTMQSGSTSTTAVLRSALSLADDIVIGAQLQIISGTGAGQTRTVSDYTGSSDTATVDAAWTTTPDNTSVYKLWAGAAGPTTPPAVNVTHFGGSAGTFASGRPEVNTTHVGGTSQTAGDIIGDTNDIQSRLPAALVGGRIDANVGAISGDATAADNLEAYTDGTTPMPVNVTQLSGDATAADNAESFFDGTGYAGTNNVIPTVTTVTNQVTANVTAISGDTVAADNLETAFDDTLGPVPHLGIIDQGTAQSATSTTIVLRSGASFADDELIGAIVWITGGSAGVGQARQIIDYVGSTDTATVAAWTTTPSGTITYKIKAGNGIDLHGRLPTALVSGRMDVSVGAMQNNVMTAAAAAADLTTELQSGLATAAALTNAQTDIDDIQSRLPAALVNGRMDSSIGAAAANTGLAAVRTATAQAGASGTVTLDSGASNTDDFYNDNNVMIVSGTGAGQTRHISDYVGSTKIATVRPNWATAPDNTSTFVIVASTSPWDQAMADHIDSGSTGSGLNAAGSAGDPWITPLPGAYGAGTAGNILASRASQASVDTVDDFLDTEVADIRNRLPAALVGGRMDVSVGAMQTDVITSTATAQSYLDEVADAVHDEVVDGSTTFRQSTRLQNSTLGGKASGLGSSTAVFRDLADTKDRVNATVDENGNRSAVTRDLS